MKHGNKGNTHAKKQVTKSSFIQMRVETRLKACFVKQANREGMKLNSWIEKICKAALDDDIQVDHEKID
jgi:predicted HicB family RNase H-like nuclease